MSLVPGLGTLPTPRSVYFDYSPRAPARLACLPGGHWNPQGDRCMRGKRWGVNRGRRNSLPFVLEDQGPYNRAD